MMRYMKNNSESGVALIFAIGLLALLLLVGLAFVGNSINYRKVAENNSSRSQARMLALSAASRAASSLQIYSHQFIKNDSSHEPPKSFDHIFSFARYDADGAVSSGGAYEYNDGLVGDYSLMLLPTGSSVLSSQRALAFNNQFLNNWPGRWVFFTNGLTGDDRRIIGRAAWQVVGSPAEILAPVFMRGAVTVDPYYSGSGSEIFYPTVRMMADSVAVASVGATSTVNTLFVTSSIGVATGVNIVLARMLGAREHERIRRLIPTSLILALILGIVVGSIGVLFGDDILRFMNLKKQSVMQTSHWKSILSFIMPQPCLLSSIP